MYIECVCAMWSILRSEAEGNTGFQDSLLQTSKRTSGKFNSLPDLLVIAARLVNSYCLTLKLFFIDLNHISHLALKQSSSMILSLHSLYFHVVYPTVLYLANYFKFSINSSSRLVFHFFRTLIHSCFHHIYVESSKWCKQVDMQIDK